MADILSKAIINQIELVYAITGNLDKTVRALGTSLESYNKYYEVEKKPRPTKEECKEKLAVSSILQLLRMRTGDTKVAMMINVGFIKQTRPEYIGYDEKLLKYDNK